MRIKILDEAQDDLIQGFRFYEGREAGLGAYFLDCLFSDIDSLLLYGGVHQVVYGHRRCPLQALPLRHLLQRGGKHRLCACRIGLSKKSIVD